MNPAKIAAGMLCATTTVLAVRYYREKTRHLPNFPLLTRKNSEFNKNPNVEKELGTTPAL